MSSSRLILKLKKLFVKNATDDSVTINKPEALTQDSARSTGFPTDKISSVPRGRMICPSLRKKVVQY